MQSKKNIAILATLIVVASLTACGGFSESSSTQTVSVSSSSAVTAPADSIAPSTGDPSNKIRLGVLDENRVEQAAAAYFLANQIDDDIFQTKFYPSMNALLLELEAGRIDSFRAPYSVCKYLIASNSKLKIIHSGNAVRSNFYMATRIEDEKLNKDLSDAIDVLKTDGTIASLVTEHLGDDLDPPTPTALVKKEGAKTYTVAITGDLPPMDYVSADGAPAGFNVALLNAISEKTGHNFEIVQLEAAARLTALQSGTIDFIFWINCIATDELTPEDSGIALTSPYYNDSLGLVSHSQNVLDEMVKAYAKKTDSPSVRGSAS